MRYASAGRTLMGRPQGSAAHHVTAAAARPPSSVRVQPYRERAPQRAHNTRANVRIGARVNVHIGAHRPLRLPRPDRAMENGGACKRSVFGAGARWRRG
jgi:hypothetical protein